MQIKNGYFLISRLIFESAIWKEEPNILKIFLWLIGNARHDKKPKKYPGFQVNRGEIVTSLSHIAEENEYFYHGKLQRLSRAKISRILKKLNDKKYIEIIADTYGTHIKICNYDVYQSNDNYKADSTETEVKRNCNGSETEVKTNKNEKNEKNDKEINISFDLFWNLYNKKVGSKPKLEKKWINLKDSERIAVMKHIPEYIKSQPDKQYRKNPETYLNNKSWNDEIITRDKNNGSIIQNSRTAGLRVNRR